MAAHRHVYLETFGCQMNTADSEVVLDRLSERGYRPVDDPARAELIVFNTCSVRDKAEAKVRSRLGELARRRRGDAGLRIAVMGCMAQRQKEELLDAYPQVDLVVGTDQFVHIGELLENVERQGRLAATGFGDFEDRNWGAVRGEGVNTWVPVMRGCNYNCTYCIVPTTRGREKSRDPALIEEEVRDAVAAGYVQVTLLGQTVDAYGKTRGDGTTLASLLRRLHEIPGLLRIRFVTSHPKDVTDELLATMAALPKVSKYLHVPAQSGSDRILRLMGRRYDRGGYLGFVARARAAMPGVALQTDMIVGFPTEGDDDFAATTSLMREVGFAGAYVFMYSPRPGTGAANLEDDVPAAVKKARCNELLALQLARQEAVFAGLRGRDLEILVEGPSKTDPQMLCGRSIENHNVVFPRRDRDDLIGTLQTIRIHRSTNLTLYGDLVPSASVAAGTA